ncbi:putative RNA-binding protein [Mycobacteroides abscessus subsp. abscessus]|nr:putative RNA-binding protein [Mycobacteroides abscessus subsp. abscessus]
MKELIETIVKPLVDFPDDVRVDVREDDHRVTYQLSVNKSDMGKVIGKQGRVAKPSFFYHSQAFRSWFGTRTLKEA